jgi:hypothetical protein
MAKKRRKRKAVEKKMEIESSEDECEMDEDDDCDFEADNELDMALEGGSPVNVQGSTSLIVSSQEIKGNWNFDQSLLNNLGASEAKIAKLKTKVTDLVALMTIIIVAWLEKFSDKGSSSMIINKGTGYLRRAKVANYKELIEEAKTIF